MINANEAFLAQIKDEQETADMIVNKAIELWQQNKGHKEYNIPKPLN